MADIFQQTRYYIFEKALAQNVWYAVLVIFACIYIFIWARREGRLADYGPIAVWYSLLVSIVLFSPLVGVVAGRVSSGKMLYFRRAWNLVPMPYILALAAVLLYRQVSEQAKPIVIALSVAVLVFGGHLIYNTYTSPWDDARGGYHRDFLWEPMRDIRKVPADTCDADDLIRKDMKQKGGMHHTSFVAPRNLRKSIRKIDHYIHPTLSKDDKLFTAEDFNEKKFVDTCARRHAEYCACLAGQEDKERLKKRFGLRFLGTTENGMYDVYTTRYRMRESGFE